MPITIQLCDELLQGVEDAVKQMPEPTEDDDWNQCRINWMGQFALATTNLKALKAHLISLASCGSRPFLTAADHEKIVTNTQSLLADFRRASAIAFNADNLN